MEPQTLPAPPHDIMGIVTGRFPWSELFVLALIAAVMGWMGWWLWQQYKRKKPKEAPVEAAAPQTDPWDLLRQKWNGLHAATPFDKKAQAQFYYELGWMLREAAELRTGVRATDMTVKELDEVLRKKSPFSMDETERVLQFFRNADLIKFADEEVSLEMAQQTKQDVERWIKKLMPLS